MKRTRKKYFKTALIRILPSDVKVIKVKFPWNLDSLAEIKSISGRKWYDEKTHWTIPLTLENYTILKNFNYKMRGDLKEWAEKTWKRENKPIKRIKSINIPGLKGKLFPFQEEGVGQLENWDGRILIADEMGLGKTIQTLAYLQLHQEKRPVIIICPASLKLNWAKEARKWIQVDSLQILQGTKINCKITADIVIINYKIISYWGAVLKAIQPKVIILDEGHYIKNNSAKRTKAVKKLCKGINHIIALTGTPIENKPVEIYNMVNIINPQLFPDPWAFKHRYCDAKYNGFGWTFNGAINTWELHNKLIKHVMIRRKKKDVLKDLPDKMYSFIPLEITNRKEYEKAENNFIKYVKDNVTIEIRKLIGQYFNEDSPVQINDEKLKRLQAEKAEKATILAQIEALKQLSVRGKMNSVIDWIENFLESGEKLILFATHKFVIEELMNKFGKIAVKIDGSVLAINREKAILNFQNNKRIKLFIGNIKAAGLGITLTAASNVAFIEYPWTPGELIQATDRAHRIGQKFTVNIHYLLALNTIEEKIVNMLDDKQKVLDAVLDGKETETSNLLSELIKTYKCQNIG